MKLKILTISIVLAVVLTFNSTTMAVQDFGDFSYWYSNSTSLGDFPASIKYKFAKTAGCQMPDTTISSSGIWALDKWNDSEGFSYSSTSGEDYNWLQCGITREEATSLGFPGNAEAGTGISSRTFLGYGHYQGSSRNVYSHSVTVTYLVWDTVNDDTVQTSGYSTTKWKAIATHEFGHACGYYGHDTTANSSNKSIMFPYTNYYYDIWGCTVPQTRDVHHMGNV